MVACLKREAKREAEEGQGGRSADSLKLFLRKKDKREKKKTYFLGQKINRFGAGKSITS